MVSTDRTFRRILYMKVGASNASLSANNSGARGNNASLVQCAQGFSNSINYQRRKCFHPATMLNKSCKAWSTSGGLCAKREPLTISNNRIVLAEAQEDRMEDPNKTCWDGEWISALDTPLFLYYDWLCGICRESHSLPLYKYMSSLRAHVQQPTLWRKAKLDFFIWQRCRTEWAFSVTHANSLAGTSTAMRSGHVASGKGSRECTTVN